MLIEFELATNQDGCLGFRVNDAIAEGQELLERNRFAALGMGHFVRAAARKQHKLARKQFKRCGVELTHEGTSLRDKVKNHRVPVCDLEAPGSGHASARKHDAIGMNNLEPII